MRSSHSYSCLYPSPWEQVTMFVDNRYKGREFLKLLILVMLQKAQILVSIKSTISSQVSLLTSQRQRVQLTVFLLGFHSKVTNSPIPHLLTQAGACGAGLGCRYIPCSPKLVSKCKSYVLSFSDTIHTAGAITDTQWHKNMKIRVQ